MNVILTSVDNTPSLLHFRTKGSKNGVRLYQYEDGSLTPLGRIHYGVGLSKEDRKLEEKANKYLDKAELIEDRINGRKGTSAEDGVFNTSDKKKLAKFLSKAEIANNTIETRIYNREQAQLRKAIANDAKTGLDTASLIKKRNDRSDNAREELSKKIDKQKNIYKMTDQELDKKIERLQKEKVYSDLLKEQANRGKKQHPMRAAVGEMLGEAVKKIAKQSLNELVDQVIARSKAKNAIKLSDYKDVDPYSLSSDKLKAVSDAFNTAANLVRNKYAVDHEGRSPNDGNKNQNDNQQNQNNPQPKQQSNTPASDNRQSKKQEKKEKQEAKQKEKQKNKQQDRVEAMARSGKTFEEIAKSLHISEAMVYKYLEDLV